VANPGLEEVIDKLPGVTWRAARRDTQLAETARAIAYLKLMI